MAYTRAQWESSGDAVAMLLEAAWVNVARARLTLAACACARLALVHVPAGEDRPRRALETAETWARGRGGADAARLAARDVVALGVLGALSLDALPNAVEAFAHVATRPAHVAKQVSYATYTAALATLRRTTHRSLVCRPHERAPEAAAREALRRMAPLVRAHVSWELLAAARRAT